jgi:uncharacterized protein (DUF2062 family)
MAEVTPMIPETTISERNPAARAGFFRRRFADPVKALLMQGTSPEQVTRTFAVGTVCSLFPFLGATTTLNLAVGLLLRMNQPILQTLNVILGPVQLVMILVYVRAGEWLWRAQGEHFNVIGMIRAFSEMTLADFLGRFGLAGWHALTAWLLTAPILAGLVYLAVRPLVRKLRILPFESKRTQP